MKLRFWFLLFVVSFASLTARAVEDLQVPATNESRDADIERELKLIDSLQADLDDARIERNKNVVVLGAGTFMLAVSLAVRRGAQAQPNHLMGKTGAKIVAAAMLGTAVMGGSLMGKGLVKIELSREQMSDLQTRIDQARKSINARKYLLEGIRDDDEVGTIRE